MSSSFRILLAGVAVVTLMAGCGDDAKPSADEPEPISYERTGGLAGGRVLLEISPAGDAVLTRGDSNDERVMEFQLTEKELRDLQTAFRVAEINGLSAPSGEPCADCFQYQLRFGPDSLQTNNESLPESIEPIIDQINEILGRCCDGENS